MKILMVADSYPPRIGGLGKHVRRLSKELANRGHEVIVFTIGYPDLPQFEEEGGVKVYRLPGFFQKIPFLYKDTASKKPPPIRDWLISKQLGRILKEEKPDVVHAHGWVLYSALPLGKEFRIPLVATLHDYGLVCPTTTLLMGNNVCDRPFTWKCVACGRDQYGVVKSLAAYLGVKSNKGRLSKVDKFVAVSSYVRRVHLKDLGLRDDDVVVIPNFYTSGGGEEIRIDGWLPEDFILFVGALVPAKGLDILIEAYQRLDTKTKLVLIGAKHPSYRYKNTENITIIENAPYEVIIQAYRNCRFAIFPSIWPEPGPTVAFEAMSYKKAVIATSIGGFTDIVVNGQTGILVQLNNTEALANAVNYLLANPDVAADMGQKGYARWKQNFNQEVVMPRIEELYQSLA